MKTNQVPARMAAAVVMAALAVMLAGCHRKPQEAGIDQPADFQREGHVVVVPEKSPLRSRLALETARSEPVRRTLTAPASIEPDPQRIVRMYPPVAGRVARLHVQLGSIVTKGQVLATLHSPDFTQAQGDFVKARSALQVARRQLERQKDLLEHKIAAARDVEQAQSDFEAAQSTLDSASARLRAYGLDPAKEPLGQPLQLVAPMAGRVVEMVAALGEFRNDNTSSLMTIADLSTVWITANAQEKDLRFIVKGQEARATLPAYPGETFTGKVEAIGDVLDPDTRVVKVRIVVANPDGRLKPGMYATVEIVDFPDTVVTVPTTAIVQVGGTTIVYEQTQPWRFEPREVTLGSQQGGRTIILKGLAGGTTILAKEGVLFQE
jgi:membrane fusion protein, heavy metal efflux system